MTLRFVRIKTMGVEQSRVPTPSTLTQEAGAPQGAAVSYSPKWWSRRLHPHYLQSVITCRSHPTPTSMSLEAEEGFWLSLPLQPYDQHDQNVSLIMVKMVWTSDQTWTWNNSTDRTWKQHSNKTFSKARNTISWFWHHLVFYPLSPFLKKMYHIGGVIEKFNQIYSNQFMHNSKKFS